MHDIVRRVDRDLVDGEPTEQLLARLTLRSHGDGVRRAHAARACVHAQHLTRLRISEAREADVRQVALPRIFDRNGHDVVPLSEELERMLDVGREKVGHDEDDGFLRQHARHVLERAGDVGTDALWLEGEEVADDAQHVAPALARRDHMLDAIGEQHYADAIVVAHGRHRQDRGQLAGGFALEPAHGTELLRAGEIHGEHDGELALLDVPLDVRAAHAGSDVPVDGAHLVAGLVLAHLGELHSLPLEHGAVLADEKRVDEAARAQLEQLDLPENLPGWSAGFRRRLDHGVLIASSTRATIASLVTSSASAS